MVVYNITISLDPNIEGKWIKWMKEVHIPDVMDTGHFRDSKLCRVHGAEEGGVTYAVTYTAHSGDDYELYQKNHAPKLKADHHKKFEGQYAAFRTILSVIEEF